MGPPDGSPCGGKKGRITCTHTWRGTLCGFRWKFAPVSFSRQIFLFDHNGQFLRRFLHFPLHRLIRLVADPDGRELRRRRQRREQGRPRPHLRAVVR